jgi:hypothetical protein
MITTRVLKSYKETRLEEPEVNESQHVALDKLRRWYSEP